MPIFVSREPHTRDSQVRKRVRHGRHRVGSVCQSPNAPTHMWLASQLGGSDNLVGEPEIVTETAFARASLGSAAVVGRLVFGLDWGVQRCQRNWREVQFWRPSWSLRPGRAAVRSTRHHELALISELPDGFANSLAGFARSFGNSPTRRASHTTARISHSVGVRANADNGYFVKLEGSRR
jgi:hypothetical protein